MEVLFRANQVSRYNLKKGFENSRIFMILVIITLFLVDNLVPVLNFCRSVNIPVAPYAFVFVINDVVFQVVLFAGLLGILCDAPFEDDSYKYMLPRARKLGWSIGQILYILKVSFIYLVVIIGATIIPFIGNMCISERWGKIWGTLGRTSAGMEFHLSLGISNVVLESYKPANAVVISIVLEYACFVWIGLLVLFINKVAKKAIGTVVGAALVLLDICIENDWVEWAYKFSPISLARISTYSGFALKFHVNLSYGTTFFIAGIVILSILCIAANYTDSIDLTERAKNCRTKRMFNLE